MTRKFSSFFAVCLFGLSVLAGTSSHAQPAKPASQTTARIVFAGGCFWCMEPPFDVLPGVLKTISGYIGGSKKDPTYQQVSSGTTGHTEAVEITYPRQARTPFNVTGHPALTMMSGLSREAGLPLSLQLVGRYFEEATVYQAAAGYERAAPWARMKPVL